MTSYNGQSITYDEIGNPLTYRDGMTMTWTGRQLTTLTQNGKQNTYKYDVDGLRLEKTAGGVTTQYQYVNGQLLGEKRSNGVVLRYTYDALGVLSGIQYKNAAGVTTNYIVRCTLSGDVDQIYDTKGNLLARYIYDTWGDTLSVTDASGKAITDPLHIANINPIRYRGYYYDAETGLYYLQSRYYDTVTKRYINPDGYVFTGQDMQSGNMFAYCGNQPVNRLDTSGSMYVTDGGGQRLSPEEAKENIEQWKAYYRGVKKEPKKYPKLINVSYTASISGNLEAPQLRDFLPIDFTAGHRMSLSETSKSGNSGIFNVSVHQNILNIAGSSASVSTKIGKFTNTLSISYGKIGSSSSYKYGSDVYAISASLNVLTGKIAFEASQTEDIYYNGVLAYSQTTYYSASINGYIWAAAILAAPVTGGASIVLAFA